MKKAGLLNTSAMSKPRPRPAAETGPPPFRSVRAGGALPSRRLRYGVVAACGVDGGALGLAAAHLARPRLEAERQKGEAQEADAHPVQISRFHSSGPTSGASRVLRSVAVQ